MKPVTSTTWLKTHRWGVRGFEPGWKSHYDGFQFARPGLWTECPDWDPAPRCGGGFHLLTPEFHGAGFFGTALALVEHGEEIVGIYGDKAKVRRLRVIPCSKRVLREALVRCGCTVAPQSGEIKHAGGTLICLDGCRARVKQSGGAVHTYDHSAPEITQREGVVWTFNSSAPRITQHGGTVHTYDHSAPEIVRPGGAA